MLENQIILVNKPQNMTSHDVVNVIKKELKVKKIGHTGTLDPIATGLMVILTNKCTKLSNFLTSEEKEYITKVKLGFITDTLDITGKILKEKKVKITEKVLVNTLNSFKGKSIQEVPIYSAIKVKGKKLYEYARENKQVTLPKKEIEVKNIELLEFSEDSFKFKVKVSKGTYIRSLIRDICNSLNCLGTMEELIRTKQGKFDLEDSYTLEEIKKNNYNFITIEELFKEYEDIEIKKEDIKKVENGNILSYNINSKFCNIKYNNKIIAVYQKHNKGIKPIITLEKNN